MITIISHYLQELAKIYGWEDLFSWLRIFDYVSVRAAGAALTSFGLFILFGKYIINWLKIIAPEDYISEGNRDQKGEVINNKKIGTPTMGGLMIVGFLDVSAMFWTVWNELLLLTVLSLLVLAGLGFYDDYKKVTHRGEGPRGIGEYTKLAVQILLGVAIMTYLFINPRLSFLVEEVMVPCFKEPIFSIGLFSSVIGGIIVVLAIIGSSNAVNLTDGLDGLAIGCTLICGIVFLIITYLTGRVDYAEYLNLTYVEGACELTVFCAALLGASLGFLWYNCHPAQVTMGDTGSLAIGGAFGIMAVLVHQPFIIIIAGGVFVLEFFSSALQRYFYKATRISTGTGKRIFKKAPLHHHFQELGWKETQVVTRFYILGIIFAVLALITLKIR